MVPLEIQGMVRACRPVTPYVGLCRQSRDPERTKLYYQEARKVRDMVCFPSMLRQSTQRCLGYRALRRLWIQALDQLLTIRQYKYYFVKMILVYIPNKEPERIPLFYSRIYWKLDYPSLSPLIRMQQMAGKLYALGYSRMVLPVPDYELEGYMILAGTLGDSIQDLYHELKRKNIRDKWHILSSWILHRNGILYYQKKEWIKLCKENKLMLYLNACIRANPLSREEIQLLIDWNQFVQFPSR